MADRRSTRDAIESLQTDLKKARAELEAPLAVQQVRTEVSARLAELDAEHSELQLQIESLIKGAEVSRQHLEKRKGELVPDASRTYELIGLLALEGSWVWLGTQVGAWLDREGFPWQLGLGLAAVCLPVAFFDVAGFVRWLRR